jgi:hypothetical protein
VRHQIEGPSPTSVDDEPKIARGYSVYLLQIPIPRKRQLNPVRGNSMEERLDEKELVILLELLMPHIIHLNTITELLFEKGIFTREEFSAKKKQVQQQYEQNLGRSREESHH